MKTSLEKFGWNSKIGEAAKSAASPGLIPARVVKRVRDSWTILVDEGGEARERRAKASGRFTRSTSVPAMPVTGDWVMVEPSDDGDALIVAVLPRSTRISRKAKGETAYDKVEEQVLVANVDLIVIAAAAGMDWNARRIERYLALAHDSGAKTVIALTKSDLLKDPAELAARTEAIAPGIGVFAVSALTGAGVEVFRTLLKPGETTVLIGSSGSGKSTLLNTLMGSPVQAVQDVREDDHKGRHTTSGRSLFLLPSGALMIDTPGLREVQLWTEGEDVDAIFPDIEALAARCRFRDCSHGSEPGCAVRGAVEEGNLDGKRLAAWRKLKLELEYTRKRGRIASAAVEQYRAIETGRRLKAIHRECDD
ncbi:MAG: ribosome small subunit-dependent GTPase A [Spirochaetes bacterium]|nr:ribosome small subunit-dependent GTPase A [Spirochaetota bacterium]